MLSQGIFLLKRNKISIACIVVGVVVLCFCIVKGGFLSGLGDKFSFISYHGGENGVHTNTDGSGDGEASPADGSASDDGTQSDVDARYQTLPREENVRDKDTYYDYPNDKLAWWIRRDDNHGPSRCDDTIDISEYGAYYLDKNAGDDNDEKVIYLTFDCGYENGYTDQILNVLAEQDVPACFFVTKTYVRDNVELIKRMKEEGHQVGNHTITHPSMPGRSYEEIIQEVTGCADYMKEVTGYDMDPYLRPPRGEYSARTLMLTHDLGYKTIFWSMAYMDFDVNNQPGVDFVVSHFRKYHHNGAIVLMHNVSSSNANALDTVITNLKAEGYRFASLNELK